MPSISMGSPGGVLIQSSICVDAEIGRLQKEMKKLSNEIGSVTKKLANENFVKKAKAEVVDRVRAREQTLQAELSRLEESLDLIRKEA